MVTTRAQREALWRLFCRKYDRSYEAQPAIMRQYRVFRRGVRWCGTSSDRYLGVRMWGMFIGIEKDGYTHS